MLSIAKPNEDAKRMYVYEKKNIGNINNTCLLVVNVLPNDNEISNRTHYTNATTKFIRMWKKIIQILRPTSMNWKLLMEFHPNMHEPQ